MPWLPADRVRCCSISTLTLQIGQRWVRPVVECSIFDLSQSRGQSFWLTAYLFPVRVTFWPVKPSYDIPGISEAGLLREGDYFNSNIRKYSSSNTPQTPEACCCCWYCRWTFCSFFPRVHARTVPRRGAKNISKGSHGTGLGFHGIRPTLMGLVYTGSAFENKHGTGS